ncbi:MAG: DMT family transporter [Rhodocyclaceae bacterium]|nr:MAG: DMT family transporter [Rhodocyclaceae bacterium]MBE7422195.1 DMT family transporter [Zoogloeaceae bacterium]MCK6385664.1 DMT family transporter [Rhodocyclaceae bacterium]
MDRRTHLDTTAMALMVVLCASWGLQQVAIKVANAGISPVWQASLRSIGAALLVWGWAAAKGIRLFERDGTLRAGLLSAALFAGEFAFIYWGLGYTTASRGVVFLYTAPFMIALGAHWLLPGERLRPLQWLGLACAFAGILAAFGESLGMQAKSQLLGDGMLLLAAVLWAATTLVIKGSRLAKVSPAKTLFYQLAGSAVVLPFVSLALGEPGVIALSPLVLASVAYQTVLVAFASYLAWFWLVASYPAGRLAAFSFLTPLFGVMAGALLLGERVSTYLALALTLVVLGIWLVNRPPRAS